MKKVLLSSFVILTFVIYSVHKQLEGGESTKILDPTHQNSISVTPPQNSTSSGFKDGQYTGDVTDAYYGNIQVRTVISGGKITDVLFLQYPNDRQTSIEISNQSMPLLKSEAIQTQNANVDIVSGATQTSLAFRQSLQTALNQAQQ